jgi:predicted nucleic acid-binding protein
MLELAENLIDEFIPIKENHLEALHEAMRLHHSAYDMLYLISARRIGATLVTLDQRLNALAAKEGIDVVSFIAPK